MNEQLVYLKVSGYLKEWCENRFGQPVKFPARSYENEIMARFIIALPNACLTPTNIDREETISIVVPKIYGKPWESYNHLTHDGERYLKAAIKNLFDLDMMNCILPALKTGGLYAALESWCKERGIQGCHMEAVTKRFFRMRKGYEEYGIQLTKSKNK